MRIEAKESFGCAVVVKFLSDGPAALGIRRKRGCATPTSCAALPPDRHSVPSAERQKLQRVRIAPNGIENDLAQAGKPGTASIFSALHHAQPPLRPLSGSRIGVFDHTPPPLRP